MVQIIQQAVQQFMQQIQNKLDVMDQRLTKIERSDRFRSVETEKFPGKLHNEFQAFIELPMEFFILPQAEQVTKPALQPLPPFPKLLIPKMACIAKKHRFSDHNCHGSNSGLSSTTD